MPFWHKVGQIGQWNRTERPQIIPRTYELLIFDRAGIVNEWGKERFSTNDMGHLGIHKGKNEIWPLFSHSTQNLILKILKT